MMSLGTSSVLV